MFMTIESHPNIIEYSQNVKHTDSIDDLIKVVPILPLIAKALLGLFCPSDCIHLCPHTMLKFMALAAQ